MLSDPNDTSHGRPVKRPVRALAATLAVALFVAIAGPVQFLMLKLRASSAPALPLLFHRLALRAIGMRVTVIGAPSAARPLLITPNHSSWIDILAFGSLMPLSFVAKSEIATWPVFGWMSTLQRTIFVDRSRKTATAAVNREMAERMASGEPVVLFAEGTSSDGNRVLPFRSALLGATQGAILSTGGGSMAVQPASIAYLRRNGLPLGRGGRPFVAWYGDMEFASHLWSILTNGAIDVVITFGDTVTADATTDRKRLARDLERESRRMTADALRGRAAAPRQVKLPDEQPAPVAEPQASPA
ncbi:lysophospholipid acyltransferase family protein [Hansschlegelia quercus]|uniref:1-acyl-sn-glycerol-3-phosphate acyltransferase n=1 Tax=Hansschlegelia quercus TaxID=2528245 RepID=A0A4Q9G9Z3_9HYPH|nr:lysophospholipid acyltransferase family protein [Hansschlegelia quercus]TBN47626.1 1-acyl-sn-glycerol-3-phosphate acyltransferase [Hansschlegelia quercus]